MGITEAIAGFMTKFIETTGLISVFIGMTMESMVFPMPSEAIMPFAGFLVAEGKFELWAVIVVATLGSIVGSTLSYIIGFYGEKLFLHKYGKYLLLDVEELDATEKFFKKFGEITVLVCRFIPVIRHLISIPAGIAKMNFVKFITFTIIGAAAWNAILTLTGFFLKQNWELVMQYSKVVDIVVLVILVGLVGFYIFKHVQRHKKEKAKKAGQQNP